MASSRSKSSRSSVGQPRQPRLHAVEDLPLRQALPLLAAPRLGGDQPLGPGPHLLGGQQLPTGEHLHPLEGVRGPLVAHRELGEPVDLVAPEIDAHRAVGRGREHVDDRAPHGELAPVLHHLLAAVAGIDERSYEVVAIALLTGQHHERTGVGGDRSEALHEGSHRRDDHAGRPGWLGQPPQHPEATAHRLHRRRHPLEREGLPGREDLHVLGSEEEAEVVGHPLGVAGGGGGDHDGPPAAQGGQTRDRQGACRFGHGQDRARTPEHGREAGLLSEQGGEVTQHHGRWTRYRRRAHLPFGVTR